MQSFGPFLRVVDVVQRPTRNDDIENVRLKRKLPRVCGLNLNSVGHTFGPGVLECDVGTVAGLILGLPEVHAHGFAGGESFGGAEQEQSPSTTDVENAFVSAP